MDDPDDILVVGPDANRLPENPMVGHRLWPERVHFEPRRLDVALLRGGPLERGLCQTKGDQHDEEGTAHEERTFPRHSGLLCQERLAMPGGICAGDYTRSLYPTETGGGCRSVWSTTQ